MCGPVSLAVPVLDTAVGVWVPAVRLAGAVQVVTAVYDLARCLGDTVLPTRSTDRPSVSNIKPVREERSYLSPQSVYSA